MGPELHTTEKYPEFVAFSTTDTYGPHKHVGGYPAKIPSEEIDIPATALTPFETSTLPEGYYTEAGLDTRYPADAERQYYIDTLEAFLAAHPEIDPAILPFFETCVFEPKYLAMYFDSNDPDKYSPEAIEAFFSHYNVANHEDALKVRDTYYRVPLPLREFAREDAQTVHEVMRKLANIDQLGEVMDADPIADILRTRGIDKLSGEERLSAIDVIIDEMQHEVSQIASEEALLSDDEAIDRRIHRKRSPLDGIDAATYRACINSGVVVDPSYLFDSRYDRIDSEPNAPEDSKIAFLRHMTNGEYSVGHSHAVIFRNLGPEASTHAGVTPDYGVSRPGNFLYHDLRLLECSPYKDDFPVGILYEYILNHYLDKMDSDLMEASGTTPEHADALGSAAIFGYAGNRHIVVPMVQRPEHVIPFRALKKTFDGTEYFSYDTDCYVAELVDIALELDKICELRGDADYEAYTAFGNGKIGTHARRLIHRLLLTGDADRDDLAVTAVEQLLFMQRQLPDGGRKHIAAILSGEPADDVAFDSLATFPEPGSTGLAERPPLTGAYEWFMHRAKPVSESELANRGVPVKPPLFKAA